jgi:hypothetical protein
MHMLQDAAGANAEHHTKDCLLLPGVQDPSNQVVLQKNTGCGQLSTRIAHAVPPTMQVLLLARLHRATTSYQWARPAAAASTAIRSADSRTGIECHCFALPFALLPAAAALLLLKPVPVTV